MQTATIIAAREAKRDVWAHDATLSRFTRGYEARCRTTVPAAVAVPAVNVVVRHTCVERGAETHHGLSPDGMPPTRKVPVVLLVASRR